MATQNRKNKTGTPGTKSNTNPPNKSKTGKGITAASMPSTSKARDKAKGMDSSRRGNTETFNI